MSTNLVSGHRDEAFPSAIGSVAASGGAPTRLPIRKQGHAPPDAIQQAKRSLLSSRQPPPRPGLAMLTVAAVLDFLKQFAPPQLAADWDNGGLLIVDGDAEVRRAMTCVTVA